MNAMFVNGDVLITKSVFPDINVFFFFLFFFFKLTAGVTGKIKSSHGSQTIFDGCGLSKFDREIWHIFPSGTGNFRFVLSLDRSNHSHKRKTPNQ